MELLAVFFLFQLQAAPGGGGGVVVSRSRTRWSPCAGWSACYCSVEMGHVSAACFVTSSKESFVCDVVDYQKWSKPATLLLQLNVMIMRASQL